jgi:hypothetical protein
MIARHPSFGLAGRQVITIVFDMPFARDAIVRVNRPSKKIIKLKTKLARRALHAAAIQKLNFNVE